MMKLFKTCLVFICFVYMPVAQAVLTIEISEGIEGAQPIAIVPFAWKSSQPAPLDFHKVIAADLNRSGQFAPMNEKEMISRPSHGSQVRYTDWRALNMNYLVVGRLSVLPDGRYQVQFQLLDVPSARQLAGYSIRTGADGLRRTAHHISDIIYKTITGEEGAFDTRIAYVTVTHNKKNQKVFRLAVADADGYNEQIIHKSSQPLMSPSWSPDGTKLAYVSFINHRPEIFIQDIYTAKSEKLASFKGLNNAPAWSPDGRKLALTLSKDGNPEIYILDIASKRLQRLTRNFAIDTEPTWLPDSSGLLFTSDRGGTPQIYQVELESNDRPGRVQRLTFEGNYNARAAISANGRHVAMIHRRQGQFRIAVLDRANGTFNVLTDSRLDESPSFAPNGRMIIYATEQRYRGVLSVVSVDGRSRQRFSFQNGDVREPVWSPFRAPAQ